MLGAPGERKSTAYLAQGSAQQNTRKDKNMTKQTDPIEEAKANEQGQEEPEGKKPEEAKPSEGQEEPEQKDPHGQPGIARGKYEREIRERDKKIAELEAKIAEAAKSEEAAKQLQSEIKQLRDDMAAKDTEHALKLKGCKSVKAASALLADYDGDIEKLAEACPFLFEENKPNGSTGGKPAGSAGSLDWIDKAMGVKRKE